ncbi:hypothetical protein Droror1_Dr00010811 [Drosera rotundifolia]
MGNCQAAEVATVVVVHPGNKVERIYWSVSAKEIMNANPGNYVAVVVAAPGGAGGGNGPPARQLKLLRPDDTLLIGHVYRLISFEDVLKEFSSKKSVKLAKLFEERGAAATVKGKKRRSSAVAGDRPVAVTESIAIQKSDNFGSVKAREGLGMGGGLYRGVVRGGCGQWKPALQSISES